MLDLRYPNITGVTEKEQLAQMRSYLNQLVDQLQWAMGGIETNQITVVYEKNGAVSSGGVGGGGLGGGQGSFAELRSLIVKTADAVEAHREEINRILTSDYVAVSDFGVYQRKTTQDIAENADGVTRTFNDVQTIRTEDITDIYENVEGVDGKVEGAKGDIKALDTIIKRVTANVNSGLLYETADGTPVYGFEVGQTNLENGEVKFQKFARFTADRLSFYDQNGSEVAWISDYKLYITDVEIKGKAKLGAFVIDTTKGFRLRYEGRG